VQVLVLVALAFVLVKSTEVVSLSLRKLATYTHLGKFGITALLLALATSLPELSVGVISALEGNPTLSLGNVLGSNIANLSLVVGGAAAISGRFAVVGSFLRRDLFLSFFAGSMPLLMLVDSRLSRFDGFVLLVVYAIFMFTVLYEKHVKGAGEVPVHARIRGRFVALISDGKVQRNTMRLAVGAGGLLISSHFIVNLARGIAAGAGVPIILVGLFLVSIGTTLPELAFEIKAIKERQVAMVFGNLLGSIVTNSTLILGLVAVIRPFSLNGGLMPYLYATLGFVLMFMIFWIFAASKKRIERWEGVVLILLFFVFAVVEMYGK